MTVLPVSIEQIAAAIANMSQAEQKQLINLVPSLRDAAQSDDEAVDQLPDNIAQLQAEILAASGGQVLSPDLPFLGDLTLGQYQALPDEKKAALWTSWEDEDSLTLDEREINPDAIPAR